MARVKRAVNAQKKRRTSLEKASGYRGQRSRLYRKAKEQLLHSATYEYRDRKKRKGDFRQLWITRINAAARENGMTYNRLIQGLKAAGRRGRPQGPRRPGGHRRAGVRRARRGRPGGAAGRRVRRRACGSRPTPRQPSGAARRRAFRAARDRSGPAVRPGSGRGPPSAGAGDVFTERTPRVVAARRLTRRAGRDAAGRSSSRARRRSARRSPTPAAGRAVRHRRGRAPARRARRAGARRRRTGHRRRPPGPRPRWRRPSRRRASSAVAPLLDVPLATALAGAPRLVAVLADVNDPGNAGTVLRTADAAGADAVVLTGGSVDPHNGKCVRATRRQPVAPARRPRRPAARGARRRSARPACRCWPRTAPASATSTTGRRRSLAGPTAWLFGNEACGLPAEIAALADVRVRIPISRPGRVLNLAAAAAVCLFASATRPATPCGAVSARRAMP